MVSFFPFSKSSASVKATSGSSHTDQRMNVPLSQRCTLHSAGHGIVPAIGINASNMTWQEATIMAVRGTRVQLKIDGQSRNFWHHDSARLFEFLGATDGQVRDASGERRDAGAPLLLWNEEHQLLGLRDDKIFSLSHLSPEPLTACVTAENR
ncbi:hypothetical protein [Rothia nasimurium]|uniref:hypothetical protein n=1 Tax=Rothia nasimurium TaxID=85336 RepID=UPI001F2C2887|nr:hypothetical protein [Rothia nasimurium]